MSDVKKTITSIFMVPTLKIPRGELQDNGFVNGYVSDGSREVQYDGCIYLLFQPKDLNKFREFLDSEYERTKAISSAFGGSGGYSGASARASSARGSSSAGSRGASRSGGGGARRR